MPKFKIREGRRLTWQGKTYPAGSELDLPEAVGAKWPRIVEQVASKPARKPKEAPVAPEAPEPEDDAPEAPTEAPTPVVEGDDAPEEAPKPRRRRKVSDG